MSSDAFKLRVVSAFIACTAGLGVWACSLNPQPIPPGFSESTGSDAGRGDDVTGPFNGGASDSGSGGDHDSGLTPSADGGADAADAESDAPSDAADAGDG